MNMKLPKDKDSVLTRFKEGVALLESALSGLQDTDLDMSPSKGGWTIRQIVHHICDGDDIWKNCIKIALGNEQAEFTLEWYSAFSQKEWADHWAYQLRSIDVSLELFKAIRTHVLQLLENIPDSWNRAVDFRNRNGEIERLPVGFIVEMQATHVEHHVKRILSIRRECEGV
jgi:uncharacterized damage-inducible protein DinB